MRHSPLVIAAVLLAGCSGLDNLRGPKASAAPVTDAQTAQAALLAGYLNSLQQLVQGSPAEQAEVLAMARSGYEQAHQGPAALRYALVLAAPGHPARDPVQAQKLLRETLARPELLTTVERALAVVELQRVDAELRLSTENQRLVDDAESERERQKNAPSAAAIAKRLQSEMEENARLRKALDEARAKLDAIANIEQRLNDRTPAPANEGRNP